MNQHSTEPTEGEGDHEDGWIFSHEEFRLALLIGAAFAAGGCIMVAVLAFWHQAPH